MTLLRQISLFIKNRNSFIKPYRALRYYTTLLGEKRLFTLVIKGYEILMEGVILKANLIPWEMNDFDVILGTKWLSNH